MGSGASPRPIDAMSDEKTPLWTANELAKATGGRWLVKPGPDFSPVKVSYDTSSGKLPNQICIMVTPTTWGKGRKESLPRLPALAKNGAACAIVQSNFKKKLPAGVPNDFPILLVNNTRHAMRDMAKVARKRFEGKVIALTGTVGKTTSREMLKHILAPQGGAAATTWNNNNIGGVQRTLCYTRRDDGYCVLEMGFGFPIDGLKTSSVQAKPHVALFTNASKAHIDAFPADMMKRRTGLELLVEHKALICAGLTKDGAAVIGTDNPHLDLAREVAGRYTDRIVTYGPKGDPNADATLDDVELSIEGSRCRGTIDGKTYEWSLRVPGRHMAINSLGALVSAWLAGADVEQCARDFSDFEAVVGRAKVGEIPVEGGTATLLDDSFNSTIAAIGSMLGVVDMMKTGEGGRRILVLGEIGHIGPDEVEQHRHVADIIGEHDVDLVFAHGELMRHMYDALPPERQAHHDMSVEGLYAALRGQLQPGDVVAVKGGRGSGGLGDRRFMAIGKALREGSTNVVI